MGTEILHPRDILFERIRDPTCRRKSFYGNYNPNFSSYNSNPRSSRKSIARQERSAEQKKRQPEPLISKRSSSADDIKISRSHHHNHGHQSPFTEKVVILRRGESLESMIKSGETLKKEQSVDMVVTGINGLGPEPKTVPKQIKITATRSQVTGMCDVYAGSAFAVSPEPSSLPLPSFSKKKQISVDDSATRDLRRLLRLDF